MFPGVKTASLRTNQWLMTENNQPASAFHIATSKFTVYPLASMSSHTWPLSVHLPNPQGQVPDNQGGLCAPGPLNYSNRPILSLLPCTCFLGLSSSFP